MKMLASTYSAIGRTKEALALKEQTLEFELRVLPADHPHIGDRVFLARFFIIFTLPFFPRCSRQALRCKTSPMHTFLKEGSKMRYLCTKRRWIFARGCCQAIILT